MLAAGNAAGHRFHTGLVIAARMTIGTVFRLFLLPRRYWALPRDQSGQATA